MTPLERQGGAIVAALAAYDDEMRKAFMRVLE